MTREAIIAAAIKEAHKSIDKDYNDLCNRIMADYRHDLSENDRYFIPPFVLGAEWALKQSPWINVKERLPEVDQTVLIKTFVGNAYFIAKIVKDKRIKGGAKFVPKNAINTFWLNQVEYWCSIPELPKEGG